MAAGYLWLALLIGVFDLVALGTNWFLLTIHARWSAPRLIIGSILAIGLTILNLRLPATVDALQHLVLAVFALTAMLWAVIRQGLGKRYVLTSLSTNGLKDWRAFNDFRIEAVNAERTDLTLIDFSQREYRLKLMAPASAVQDFVAQHIKRS
ncbi:hypothetical protein [Lapidilactobacillus luobeiensis]|uniref:hypothetical protein n=1 Tax=Lapidilactobacillus luobeiensis TaxID=2950371 RepID=UPI0021C25F87|nr:hypothetical protein [Lapidilactobacillus luobeiensis]